MAKQDQMTMATSLGRMMTNSRSESPFLSTEQLLILTSIPRNLDDSELDSGDNEGREDRLAHTVEDEELMEPKQINEVHVEVAPIRPPEGDEVSLILVY
jgi:hypothetical protein